jgi:hypothetical protein
MPNSHDNKQLLDFLIGKSEHTLILFDYFVSEYQKLGDVSLHPAKTMIGVSNGEKRIAWITQLGKNFIHIVFPLKKEYSDNLSFQKIAQVPGEAYQFNHHFRMYLKEDVNEEVIQYMLMAYIGE